MRAVFIDRDGTMGGDTEATYPQNFVLYDNVLDSIELLKASGFKVIAFTNQPDIAMGKVSQKEFEDELFGFKFDDVCVCPHLPSDLCKCRKPGTYMLETMITKYGLNRTECYVIGDRWSDMLAGINAKMKIVLVKTGCGNDSLIKHSDKWDVRKASYIATNLSEAVKWIISKTTY